MSVRPHPVVCYKRLDDDTEIIVRSFTHTAEALKWAKENNIMSSGSVGFTIMMNDYLPPNQSRVKKYPNRHLYRFAKV
ncbi:hypothetical protein ACQKKK_16865 [Peribacillus sp. NPDC006672]|uniref:hypothetical protein n=1 Tax=Peribacillus sp. NPDC006672 TaxID=3390606 RepID=UPI003D0475DA